MRKNRERDFGIGCRDIIADLSIINDIRMQYILIHNAGIFLAKKEITPDGIEKVFAVNYLSSFIINFMFKDRLISQKEARKILVNS